MLSKFEDIRNMKIENKNGKIRINHGNNVIAESRIIPANLLIIDNSYQRNCNANSIAKIKNEFNTLLVNPLKVVERDGVFHVFDGQHTLQVLRELNEAAGNDPDFPVDCKVFTGIDFETECELFEKQNGYSTRVTNASKLKALIAAGNEKAIEFENITLKYGFMIPYNYSRDEDHYINCFTVLYNYYLSNGPELYDKLLKLLNTWGGVKESITANIVNGIIMLLRCMVHNENNTINSISVNRREKLISDINDERFINKLNPLVSEFNNKQYNNKTNKEMIRNMNRQSIININSEADLIKRSKKNMSAAKAYAITFIRNYNNKLRNAENRLNEEKLEHK